MRRINNNNNNNNTQVIEINDRHNNNSTAIAVNHNHGYDNEDYINQQMNMAARSTQQPTVVSTTTTSTTTTSSATATTMPVTTAPNTKLFTANFDDRTKNMQTNMTAIESLNLYIRNNNIIIIDILYTSMSTYDSLNLTEIKKNEFVILFFRLTIEEFYKHLNKKFLKNHVEVLNTYYTTYYKALIHKNNNNIASNSFMSFHKQRNIPDNIILVFYNTCSVNFCLEPLCFFCLKK